MTVTQWWAVIIHGGKIFVGLIFVVEGTHENFNTTKISAYIYGSETCTEFVGEKTPQFFIDHDYNIHVHVCISLIPRCWSGYEANV